MPAHGRRIGYVFQDGRLFPHLTVEQNLRFASAPRAAAGRSTFGAAVQALDLATLLARRPSSLSGGEQQRVAIARALLTSPRLMLMDEPLSSLDVVRKREIVPHIEKLPETFGVPVLYVTHNVDEVARLANDVVLLVGGQNRRPKAASPRSSSAAISATSRAGSRPASCCERKSRHMTTASQRCASARSSCACR